MSDDQNSGQARSATQSTRNKTFNPIELGIFLAFSVVFLKSVLGLMNGKGGLQVRVSPQAQQGHAQEARQPASLAAEFTTLEFNCQSHITQATAAQKVRITGPLCGMESQSEHIKTDITNLSNQTKGTAFNHPNQTFLTDYIPLELGENQIVLKFVYQNGKTISQTITLNRHAVSHRSPASKKK